MKSAWQPNGWTNLSWQFSCVIWAHHRRVSEVTGVLTAAFPDVLAVFTTLLHRSPTSSIWAFDTSPELPHTLFSEIKNNRLFKELLAEYRPLPDQGSKGKGKAEGDEPTGPLGWINDFLLSVLSKSNASSGSAFPEALAKVMSFCLSEMQHDRIDSVQHGVAAEAGFTVSGV